MLTDNQMYKWDTISGAFDAVGLSTTDKESRTQRHYNKLIRALAKKLTWKEIESLEHLFMRSALRNNHIEKKKQSELGEALAMLSGLDIEED